MPIRPFHPDQLRQMLPAPIKKAVDFIYPENDPLAGLTPPVMGMVTSPESGLFRQVLDRFSPDIPTNRWAAGAQPKVGGALHEVLSRAALKSGIGDTPTLGESQLLNQFMGYNK